MQYEAPYGSTDPSSPYINGNPSTGTMGSIPPAASIENPQRELANFITASQITPDRTDLLQLTKGVRAQTVNYQPDQGLVNQLQVALNPVLLNYTVGLPLRVMVKYTNTGPATINAGPGVVGIKKPTGAEMSAGDLPAGGIIELVYDGTNFQMINFGGSGGGPGDVYLVDIPYCVDSSSTANTITANFSPAITTLKAGTLFMVKVANTNTGPTTISVNGLPGKPVYAQGGAPSYPLLPSDMVAGDVLLFTYDGSEFWIYANGILNQNVTFNISTTAQYNALFFALGRKRILSTVIVTIQLATGIYQPLWSRHPNADNILVSGTMIGPAPQYGDFQKNGSSSAQRAQDSANNIAMLRTRYGTEVQFNNSSATYYGALRHDGPGAISYQNILVTGANVDAGSAEAAVGGVACGPASAISCNNVTVWGSGSYGFVMNGGSAFFNSCFACGCFTDGFVVTGGGKITMQQCG